MFDQNVIHLKVSGALIVPPWLSVHCAKGSSGRLGRQPGKGPVLSQGYTGLFARTVLNGIVLIEKTEAVVLREVNYRDSIKIVTFYTKRYGKMSAIAKDAHNPESKYGSLFQPLNYLQIVFSRRESREMQYVSSSDFMKYFKSLTVDVERFSLSLSSASVIFLQIKTPADAVLLNPARCHLQVVRYL